MDLPKQDGTTQSYTKEALIASLSALRQSDNYASQANDIFHLRIDAGWLFVMEGTA